MEGGIGREKMESTGILSVVYMHVVRVALCVYPV